MHALYPGAFERQSRPLGPRPFGQRSSAAKRASGPVWGCQLGCGHEFSDVIAVEEQPVRMATAVTATSTPQIHRLAAAMHHPNQSYIRHWPVDVDRIGLLRRIPHVYHEGSVMAPRAGFQVVGQALSAVPQRADHRGGTAAAIGVLTWPANHVGLSHRGRPPSLRYAAVSFLTGGVRWSAARPAVERCQDRSSGYAVPLIARSFPLAPTPMTIPSAPLWPPRWSLKCGGSGTGGGMAGAAWSMADDRGPYAQVRAGCRCGSRHRSRRTRCGRDLRA